MTVIRPNGISGITSITSSGDAINFFKSDGTLGPVLGLNINATSGISTFAALNVTGVLTYEDVTSVDSVGIITARSDLSIADKIIHTGDTNTAIRFPAADTVTVETGGTERLRVNSSGHLGIGAANNTSYDTNAMNLLLASSGNTGMTIRSAGATPFAMIHFADGTTDNSEKRAGRIVYQHDGDNMMFNTANAERLRIKGTGQVLIGTATEGHADADDLTLQAPSGYTGITLRSGTTTGGAIYFSDATSGTGELDGQIVYSQNSRTMTFATAGVTKLTLKSDGLLVSKAIQATANVTPTSGNGVEVFAPTSSVGQIQAYDRDNSQWNDFIIKGQTIQIYANNSERLRIDSSGNLGINNNNPSQRVHVGGNIEFNSHDSTNGNGGYYTAKGLIIGNAYDAGKGSSVTDDRNAIIWQERGLDLDFATNNAVRMKLTYDGKLGLGLGTNSPTDHGAYGGTLEISGSPGGALYLKSGSDVGQLGMNSSGLQLRTRTAKDILFTTNNTERMRIDSGGDVGIGNDASFPIFTDDRSLILGAGSGSVGLQLYSSTTGYNGIYFGDANTGGDRYKGYIEYKHNDDWLRFAVNGQERVRITSSGRMGVGTNNPAIKLHVVDSSSTPIRLQNTGGGSVYTQYVNNDNARGYVGYEGKRLAFYADNGSNTGDIRVAFMDADGLKFFNDTAAANALDDYEEGSWTPSIQFATGQSGSFTYGGNNGAKYTKIGRVVYVHGLIDWSNHNLTAGTQLILAGLPYQSASGNVNRSGISISYSATPWTSGPTVYQSAFRSEESATHMTFNYSNTTNGSISNTINYNQVDTTGAFIFFGMYVV